MKLNFEQFLTSVASNSTNSTLVLTANLRQSRQLSALVRQHEHQKSVFVTRKILALSVWFESLWGKVILEKRFKPYLEGKKLCSKFESQLIWNDVIESSEDIPSLVNKNDFLRQIQSCYDICNGYSLNDNELRRNITPETDTYIKLKNRYLKELERREVVDVHQYLNLLATHGGNLIDGDIYLFGFSELPPLHEQVLNSLCIHVPRFVEDKNNNKNTSFYACETDDEEVKYAATWAEQKIESLSNTIDKGQISIGIVIPDLAAKKHIIERALFKQLEPRAYISKNTQLIPSLFDVSAGEVLAGTHIIRTAYLLPRLSRPALPSNELEYLLRSPYWGEGVCGWRQKAIARVDGQPTHLVNIYQILPEQSPPIKDQTPSIEKEKTAEIEYEHKEFRLIANIRKQKEAFNQRHLLSEWVSRYKSLLQLAEFPGKAPLSSYEYQIVKRFFIILDEIEHLDSVFAEKVSYKKFEEILFLKLSEEVFHPEVKKPQIHVLGLMEAAGLRFDQCLVIGLTETTLPQSAKPHPFIPMSLQRKYNTPRSSAERELNYAASFLKVLVGGASEITLGYAKKSQSEVTRPSPLLLKLQDGKAYQDLGNLDNNVFTSAAKNAITFNKFDHIELGDAPIIPEEAAIRGGAYLLDLHWVNPLFAFFKYRLGVDKMDSVELGLSGKERGVLIHSLLHTLYKKHPDKQSIHTFLASNNHFVKIRADAERIIKDGGDAVKRLSELNLDYEIDHISKVALEALKLDADRIEDFKINSLEKKYELEVHRRHFSTRIDRIDSIDENLLVIDFKTGKSQISGMTKNPISDHQLPFYAQALNHQVIGLAYMETLPNAASLKGICDPNFPVSEFTRLDELKRSELPPEWTAAQDAWRHCISDRVNEIVHGKVNYIARIASKQNYYTHYLTAVRPEEMEPYQDEV